MAEGDEIIELIGVVIACAGVHRAAHGGGGEAVGAGGATEAEIDPAGVHRLEEFEGLGDAERRVVRQHDAAGANADALGAAGDVADHEFRAAAGEADEVVMLGIPRAVVAEAVGRLGEEDRVFDRLGGAASGGDGTQIKNGQDGHEETPAGRSGGIALDD